MGDEVVSQIELAKIEKLISDHAESIYQTWKAKGLTPNEILKVRPECIVNKPSDVNSKCNPAELIGTPNLEKQLKELVQSFITEDKARQARQQSPSPSNNVPKPRFVGSTVHPNVTGSSVQFALQRFEQKNRNGVPARRSSLGSVSSSPDSSVESSSQPHVPGGLLSDNPRPLSCETSLKNYDDGFSIKLFPEESNVPTSNISAHSSHNKGRYGSGNETTITASASTWPGKGYPNNEGAVSNPPGYRHLSSNGYFNSKSSGKSRDSNGKFAFPTKSPASEISETLKAVENDLIQALNSGAPFGISQDVNRTKAKNLLEMKNPQETKSDGSKPSKFSLEVVGIEQSMEEAIPVKLNPVSAINMKSVSSELQDVVNTLKSMDLSAPSSEIAYSDPKPSKYRDVNNMGPVDFAKIRFRDIQDLHDKGCDMFLTSKSDCGLNTVFETKHKFESGRVGSGSNYRGEWLPNKFERSGGYEDYQTSCDKRKPKKSRKPSSPEPHNVNASPLPHPELSLQQKQHLRERCMSANSMNYVAQGFPVRPFLTRGSVAERVLIFEKCPSELRDKSNHVNGTEKRKLIPLTSWRSNEVSTKAQFWRVAFLTKSVGTNISPRERDPINKTVISSSVTSVFDQKPAPKGNAQKIARFFHPLGKAKPIEEVEAALQKVATTFQHFPDNKIPREQCGLLAKACDLPLYWKIPLFSLVAEGKEVKEKFVEKNAFIECWRRMLTKCHDHAALFVNILTKEHRNYLLPEDFVPMLQDVVDSHPGLCFLKEATEFHSRYVLTVIARIYYCVNRSWSGRITVPELRKSNFLKIVEQLEAEEDINQILDYFSYEHFYVIYCKFWELDRDHDLFIDRDDLSRHNDFALSRAIIDRIFSGAVFRKKDSKDGKMSYNEFIWFLISEEDKRHPTAIEYWFRCMDIDGDGFISMYELEYFYSEQLQRLETMGIEAMPFEDCLCQMLDMIRPKQRGKITLSDLKKCKLTPIFFDTFFNLEKYLDHEHRDPFASQREVDVEGQEALSDWERFAAEEYELLVAEEGGSEQHDELMYEDEADIEDELSPNLDNIGDIAKKKTPKEEDFPDYAADSEDYQY